MFGRRLRLLPLALVLLMVTACAAGPAAPAQAPLEPDETTALPEPLPSVTRSAQATDPPVSVTVPPQAAPSAVAEPSRWVVGLLDEPATLVPFSPDGRAAAPVVEAIFPSPALAFNYAYTTTGVLEELPTLENGGVERRAVSGFLDATGQFTTTATAQPTTTDQLLVTFRWNPDLHWADGRPVTAADSVFAWEVGRAAPSSPEAAALIDLVEQYEALDAHTTRVTLLPGRADASYPLLAWPPQPRHILEDASEDERLAYMQAPLGYGPYTFGEALRGTSIVLRRNDFWPGHDLPEQLRFDFFASAEELRAAVNRGDVDVASIEQIPTELYRYLEHDAASNASDLTWLRGPVYEHLDLNLAEPLLQDPRVRRAIAHAIDRQGMIDALFGGKTEPLQSWIFPEQTAYAGDEQLVRYPYDPERARSLLGEAGLSDADEDGVWEMADGAPISLTLVTSDTPLRLEIARRVEADLQRAGLRVRTEALPLDQLYAPGGPLFRRQFQLALFAWLSAADPHGLPLWSCSAIPSAKNGYRGNNFAGWCFQPAEAALQAATATIEPRTRAAAYLRHQQFWSRETPSIPLLQRPLVVLRRPDVQGVVADALAPVTWNVDEWKRGD